MSDTPLSINQEYAMRAAKGKGCDARFRMADSNTTFNMFLGGAGMTEFSSSSDRRVPLPQLRAREIVATDWVNNRFFGRIPAIGEVVLDFETTEKSNKRSSAIVIAEGQNDIFPAKIVNTLFFKVTLPGIGKTLFNKEPMVLLSRSSLMNATLLRDDIRVKKDPDGLPRHLKTLLDNDTEADFLPLGTHRLQNAIALYDADEPDRIIAYMESAEVKVVAHYGLEVSLKSSIANDGNCVVELEIENKLKESVHVHWFASAVRNLSLTTPPEGSLDLQPTATATISLAATKRQDTPLTVDDILVIGFSNIASSVEELRTAYVALTVSQ